MPDPWDGLSDNSALVRHLQRLKDRFAAKSGPDFELLQEFSLECTRYSELALTTSRSASWWRSWKQSMASSLLQDCMAAAIEAVPAAAEQAALPRATAYQRFTTLQVVTVCLRLLHQLLPASGHETVGIVPAWLHGWIRAQGRMEGITSAVLAVSKIPLVSAVSYCGLANNMQSTAIFCWNLLHSPTLAILPIPACLELELHCTCIKMSTSLMRCLSQLGPEQQPFIQGRQAYIDLHLSSDIQEQLSSKSGIWYKEVRQLSAFLNLQPKGSGDGADGSSLSLLADERTWKAVVPVLLQVCESIPYLTAILCLSKLH